jgi:hypothetical protein
LPDPFVRVENRRLSLALNLGIGAPRRRKLEDINNCLSPTELRNYLMHARVWESTIEFDRGENNRTPGQGYCGFISMDRIINGMDRSIGPSVTDRSSGIHDIIKTLSDNSNLPLRNNWRNIILPLRSARELLATTDQYLRKNKSNWIALEHLPEELWLNGGEKKPWWVFVFFIGRWRSGHSPSTSNIGVQI